MDQTLFKKVLEENPTETQYIYWKNMLHKYIQRAKISDPTEKLDTLQSLCGAETFKYVDEAASYDEALLILDRKYQRLKSTILARHQLRSLRQESMTIEAFFDTIENDVKRIQTPQLTAEQHRDQLIADVFICGINSKTIQQRLLETSTDSTPIKQLLQTAIAVEQAINNSNAIINNQSTQAAALKSTKKCNFCGNNWHKTLQDCPARNSKCQKCQRIGHWAIVCKSSKTSFQQKQKNSAIQSTNNDNDSDEDTNISSITATTNSKNSAHVKAMINGQQIQALIDTGSDSTFVEKSFVVKHGIEFEQLNKTISLANKSTFKILGQTMVDITLNNTSYRNFNVFITESLVMPFIVGKDLLSKHSSINLNFGGKMEPKEFCLLMKSLKMTPLDLMPGIDKAKLKPIVTKSRTNHKNKEFIDKEISSMLKNDIIKESRSPWRAQCFVTNNEKKPRLVIDFSETINKYTILDAYPMPTIEELIKQIAQNKVFSTIDMKSAYHQVPIKPEDYYLTAFEANGKLYEFKRLPFGCTNVVPIFQRTMNEYIEKNKLEGTHAYLDDIIIGGTTTEEHNTRLNQFLSAADEFGIQINREKSKFEQTRINYLGYTIENSQTKPDEERIKHLMDFPIPDTLAKLNRLIGLFAYYAKWIEGCSNLTQELTNSREEIKKSGKLSTKAESAINQLKNKLSKATLLAPDFKKPFVIETDASDLAIGATLNQDGRPVAFISRSLSKTERRQSIVEREATAIIEAVRRWRTMLSAVPHFTIITDQKPVSFIFSKSHPSRIKSDKLARWRLELIDYNFNITYRPGNQNTAADTLSRCGAIKDLDNLKKIHEDLCHPGSSRMLHYCRSYNLAYTTQEIRNTIENCKICKEVKPKFFKPPNKKLIQATRPWERLSIDFIGPLPSKTQNKYILSIIDEYSRYPFALPCENMLAETVIAHLRNIFSMFGSPSSIHSDRGTQFESEKFKNFLRKNDIIKTRTTPYAPWANGQCERMNGSLQKTINLCLRTLNLDKDNWEKVLPMALSSIRALLCKSTNETPHSRLFNFQRHSTKGTEIPDFLIRPDSTILHKQHIRNKGDPLLEKVISPYFARVDFENGRRETVSTRNLALYVNEIDGKTVDNIVLMKLC